MSETIIHKINPISFADLKIALKLGIQDFISAPLFGLFFAGIYVCGGILLVTFFFMLDLEWAIYPLMVGFALIGPFIATGLYEVSRRRAVKKPLEWRGIIGVIWEQRNRELGWMAFVTLFVFWVWMYQARTIFVIFFGSQGFASMNGFLEVLFSTSTGFYFLLTGHVVGAIISIVLFTLTVISCPMLLDKEIDFVTAMLTSIRSVIASPIPMLCWGVFVVLTVMLSMIPGFLGLLLTLPILGHSTWHLYKLTVTSG